MSKQRGVGITAKSIARTSHATPYAALEASQIESTPEDPGLFILSRTNAWWQSQRFVGKYSTLAAGGTKRTTLTLLLRKPEKMAPDDYSLSSTPISSK